MRVISLLLAPITFPLILTASLCAMLMMRIGVLSPETYGACGWSLWDVERLFRGIVPRSRSGSLTHTTQEQATSRASTPSAAARCAVGEGRY